MSFYTRQGRFVVSFLYLKNVRRGIIVSEQQNSLLQSRDSVLRQLFANEIARQRLQRLEIQLIRVHGHPIPDQSQLELKSDLMAAALHFAFISFFVTSFFTRRGKKPITRSGADFSLSRSGVGGAWNWLSTCTCGRCFWAWNRLKCRKREKRDEKIAITISIGCMDMYIFITLY